MRRALALALLGYAVKEMIGGIEYWTREGFPVAVDGDVVHATRVLDGHRLPPPPAGP